MYRIGQSTDIHKFCDGEFIVLGGEKIPFEKGVEAHSDGDALCHAIAESILGALALGDLGTHFPDTDPAYKGVSSIQILCDVVKKMKQEGYEVNNLDALILIEKPKMAPYITAMQNNVMQALQIQKNQVSIKATRGEQIGLVGRGEGVVCQCVILLKRRNEDE